MCEIAANWVASGLFGALNKLGVGIEQAPILAEKLAGLPNLIADGTISTKIAKDVFAIMLDTDQDAARIVEEKGLRQVGDSGAIEAAIDRILAGLPNLIADGTISTKIAKDVFAIMLDTDQDAARIVEEKGLRQVGDSGAIEAAIDRILAVRR